LSSDIEGAADKSSKNLSGNFSVSLTVRRYRWRL